MILTGLIGDFGSYQLWLNVLLFFCKYGMAFQYLAFLFLAPPMTFTCPSGDKCCPDPQFNTSVFSRTIQSQWNLICDKEWLVKFTETLFICGISLGSTTLGVAADEYGRRIIIIVASITETLSGILAALSHYDYWAFTFLRMITGFSMGGLMVSAYVILIESIGVKARDICSAIHQLTFTLGHLSLAIIGYFIRDFVQLQLIISCLNVTLFVYICSMPESPRWLLAVGRTEEAVQFLEKEARINKLPRNDIRNFVDIAMSSHVYRKRSLTDLCKNRKLRRYAFLVSFNWFTCNYYFFGVTKYITDMAEDVFTQVLLVAIIGNMGVLLSIPLMSRMGRVSLTVFANVICGVCSIIYGFINEPIASVAMGIIGIIFNCVVFVVIFLHCCEIFPTVLRGTALGIASMTACLGSIVAPFVSYLKPMGEWCEPVAYGVLPLLVALLYFMVPETKSSELPDTIDESCTHRPRRHVVIKQRSTRMTTTARSPKSLATKTPSLKSAQGTQPLSSSTVPQQSTEQQPILLDVIKKKQSEDADNVH